MVRIRGFILAAFTMVALAAVPAAASASVGLVADEYPATLHGNGTTKLAIGVAGASTLCNPSNVSFEATLSKPSSSVSTSSVQTGPCESGSFEMKGCQFELKPVDGSVSIGPPGCGPVRFVPQGCFGQVFSIPAQGGLAATYTNAGSGSGASVTLHITANGVEYTTSGGLCVKAGTYKGVSIDGTLQVTATNAGKSAIGTRAVTHGLYPAGGAGGGEPRLEATKYPADLSGERYEHDGFAGIIKLLDTGSQKATCTVAEYDGGELSGPALNEFSLNATYSGCKIGSTNVSVSMNSCHYVYSSLTYDVEGRYDSAAKIACNAGDAIKIAQGSACTVKIPAQTLGGLGDTELVSMDAGDESFIGAVMTATGVDYTAEQTACGLIGIKKGSYENGSLESDMLLRAFP